ncbi:MAG: DUF2079 domain-containing protein [Chloroflexi bacterium]|nr:DUF2079 domain-containing protein [Chloroflexota bacterium]
MDRRDRASFLSMLLVVTLGSLALGFVLWDRDYPGWFWDWWQGLYVYRYFRVRLWWYVFGAGVLGPLLWLWGVWGRIRLNTWPRTAFWQQGLPYLLLLLTPVTLLRYTWHPLGTNPGSSVWTYLFIPPLALTLAVQVTPWFPPASIFYRRHPRSLWALMGLFIFVFGGLASARHLSYNSHALDMATMAQAAWNTAHGRLFEYTPLFETYVAAPPLSNRLASGKLELIFLIIAPLYRLFPTPLFLVLLQALALGLAAWPLYHITRHVLRSHWPALFLSMAYLAYLPLHYVMMADFHPSALMPFFLSFAVFYALQRRWRLYFLFLFGALLCRIDAAFVAMGLSLYFFWRRRWRVAMGTLLLAAFWLWLDFRVVVPWVEAQYGPDPVGLLSQRFGRYGRGPLSIILGVLLHPRTLLSLFLEREKLQTLFDLLVPLGGAPLLAPAWLLPAAPVAFLNLLAESAWQGTIKAHYFAPVLPFLFIAAAYGIRWMHGLFSAWFPPNRRLWATGFALYVLLSTLLVDFYMSPFPLGRDFRLSAYWTWSPHHEAIRTVLHHVAPSARLSGQSNLLPHVAHRRYLYLFPSGDEVAEEVLLDLDFSAERAPLDFYAFYETVDRLIHNPSFGLKMWQNGVLLLARGYPFDPEHITALRREYDAAFYRVRWLEYKGPTRMDAGEVYKVKVCLQNVGSQGWRSTDWHPTKLSYHWRDSDNRLLVLDGERASFHTILYPTQSRCVPIYVYTPARAGDYLLQFDLVREQIAWFSDMGAPTLDVWVRVGENEGTAKRSFFHGTERE